jgi:hypothetical protein
MHTEKSGFSCDSNNVIYTISFIVFRLPMYFKSIRPSKIFTEGIQQQARELLITQEVCSLEQEGH